MLARNAPLITRTWRPENTQIGFRLHGTESLRSGKTAVQVPAPTLRQELGGCWHATHRSLHEHGARRILRSDFAFTALSLSAPERQRFKYRLQPFDKNWVDAGTQRTAHYTNMAPGEYSDRISPSRH